MSSLTARISAWSAIREGTINSLTNPKSLLFMFAFLPQFVDPGVGPVWLQLAVLGTIQKSAGILSLGSVAMASGTIGQPIGVLGTSAGGAPNVALSRLASALM